MIIGGYTPCSLCDFPGMVAAVVFLQGCNFDCPYCHNRTLIPRCASKSCEIPYDAFMNRIRYRKGRLDAVVISGGEPTVHRDLSSLIDGIRSLGFLVKLDTNGSNPDMIGSLLERRLIDFIAMDIKAPFRKYMEVVKTDVDTSSIKASIEIIAKSGISHTFRTTFVPGLLNEADLNDIETMVPLGSGFVVQEYREPPHLSSPHW